MGKIANWPCVGIPRPVTTTVYANYIGANFTYQNHPCGALSACKDLGCGRSWTWKYNKGPNRELTRQMLAGPYRAFRGMESDQARRKRGAEKKKKEVFWKTFHQVVALVRPLGTRTILCDWDENTTALIQAAYDGASKCRGGTVLTTKTLHFLKPDLFVMLDRKQVYEPYNQEIPALPWSVNDIDYVDGETYVKLLQHVSQEVRRWIIRCGGGAIEFRNLSTRVTSCGQPVPSPICRIVDDIMRA